MMLKHRIIMVRAESQTMPGKVIFRSNEDEVKLVDQSAHWLDYANWQEMGHPDTITITVEPGDRMNPTDCVGNPCPDHKLVQHRDGKPPWCEQCGTSIVKETT